jgi:hypothetical protein
LQTFCPGWLRTSILLIFASQLARITGVSHWRPASMGFFLIYFVVNRTSYLITQREKRLKVSFEFVDIKNSYQYFFKDLKIIFALKSVVERVQVVCQDM